MSREIIIEVWCLSYDDPASISGAKTNGDEAKLYIFGGNYRTRSRMGTRFGTIPINHNIEEIKYTARTFDIDPINYPVVFINKNNIHVTIDNNIIHTPIIDFCELSTCFTVSQGRVVMDRIIFDNNLFVAENTKKIYDPLNIVLLYDDAFFCDRMTPPKIRFQSVTFADLINDYNHKYYKDYGDYAEKLYNIDQFINKSLGFTDEHEKLKDMYVNKLIKFENQFLIQNNVVIDTGISKLTVYPIIFAHLLLIRSPFFKKHGFDFDDVLCLPKFPAEITSTEIDLIAKLLFASIYRETLPSVRELLSCGSDFGKTLFVFSELIEYFVIDVYPEYIKKIISLL